MESYKVVIIGGGASGLMAGALLASKKVKGVAIVERGERVGKKLSATGNGQGNITNLTLTPEKYFTDDIKKAFSIISSFDNDAVTQFLQDLGGLFLSDESGRVYPASKQASAVTDLLRGYLLGKVDMLTGKKVTSVKKSGNGFIVSVLDEKIFAEKVVVAVGGKAQKNFGSDGNFYDIVKSLGHTVTPLYPSLVQLKTDTTHIKTLKGIRVNGVARALASGKEVASSRGDVIFTEYGVSGNAIFSISPYIAGKENATVSIELLPSISKEKLTELLERKIKTRPDIEKSEMLSCYLSNQVGRAVMKRVKSFTPSEIVNTIKNFTLPVTGTLGFDYAQVTKGGIPLSEVSDNLESKKVKGLFFTGEILNVDGECGGYNLQWAFSSANAVAEEIAK